MFCKSYQLYGQIYCFSYFRGIIIENRIYNREEFTRKKKTAILLYCFHTAGVLHICMLYNLLGPGISFYRKSKINIKRKPNYEIGWFYNWPMIISLYKGWFSVITINQMMFLIHISFYKVYLTALKNLKLKRIVKETSCINVLYCI